MIRLLKETPNARQRRLVEGDQRVAKRDEHEQLGEVEHLVAKAVVREHHPDALPGDQDGGERQEQTVAEAQELRFVDRQQVRDRLLHGGQKVEFGMSPPTVVYG